MKLCAYVTEYLRMKCAKFGQDASRFHSSTLCLVYLFSGHSVAIAAECYRARNINDLMSRCACIFNITIVSVHVALKK